MLFSGIPPFRWLRGRSLKGAVWTTFARVYATQRCDGPDPVYGIAMDVCRQEHHQDLRKRMLLLGALVYASGKLGEEPVRSQGHIHATAPHSGWSRRNSSRYGKAQPSSTPRKQRTTTPAAALPSPPPLAIRWSCRQDGRTASSMLTQRAKWLSEPGVTASMASIIEEFARTAAWHGFPSSQVQN